MKEEHWEILIEKWGKRIIQKEKASGVINKTRIALKDHMNHVVLYLPKITYNTHKYMYI